ncbi:MAG TPA: DUF1553 domain-containing protein [Candidatus Hydrogenedentes bacterium]|nr:DUF1553 domain-containing protein [Candidatus Hydrogenedentota bacterium]
MMRTFWGMMPAVVVCCLVSFWVKALPASDEIDALVRAKVTERGLTPAPPCSDEVFFRRVYLDVIGTLPAGGEVTQFLHDERPDKRARCIHRLLAREEFNDYWALKWCDLLRVKAEFPINLWPNAVQSYHRWIRDAVKANMPYDAFARALLTSSGSNFREPPVNFYRAVQGREPAAFAAAVALTFMGSRIESWPEEQRARMEVFFSRLAFKGTDEWKEEIVCWEPLEQPEPLDAVFPDGVAITIPTDQDPRALFAAWLTAPENPWFARAIANRVWSWFLGRGIIHEPDDIRPDNPPVNPELLACLERQLIRSHYNLKQLFRVILNSATYQQSSVASAPYPEAEAVFACYPARRLEAEVLSDALNVLFGTTNAYTSAIPEPFTYIPEEHRTITLADGSITDSFLETFGRPSRDTGLESERNNQVTTSQRLYLLNSSEVQKRIVRGGGRLAKSGAPAKGGPMQAVRQIYLQVLSRFPTKEETAVIREYLQRNGAAPKALKEDVTWALINSKEFLYRH